MVAGGVRNFQGVGLFLSRVAYKAISPSGQGQSALLGNVTRIAILIFTGAMALFRAGLASDIVTLAFGAVIVGLALAARWPSVWADARRRPGSSPTGARRADVRRGRRRQSRCPVPFW